MIETDSPYLLPYPRVKGEKRNDSSKLPRIAAKIAALRGLTEAEVEHLTTENGKAFFPPCPEVCSGTVTDPPYDTQVPTHTTTGGPHT